VKYQNNPELWYPWTCR